MICNFVFFLFSLLYLTHTQGIWSKKYSATFCQNKKEEEEKNFFSLNSIHKLISTSRNKLCYDCLLFHPLISPHLKLYIKHICISVFFSIVCMWVYVYITRFMNELLQRIFFFKSNNKVYLFFIMKKKKIHFVGFHSNE